MKTAVVLLFAGFFLLSVYDCYSAEKRKPRVVKPLLMPLLAIGYCAAAAAFSKGPVQILLVLGLICGFLGDTFLIKETETMFTLGLGSFLLGHVFYIILFLRDIAAHPFPVILLAAVPVYLAAAVIIMRRLLPAVDAAMRVPVIAYMAVILTMSYLALIRFGALGRAAGACAWFGSLLFVLSDTILAFSVFCHTTEKAIMETYVCAQFLIVLGVLLI